MTVETDADRAAMLSVNEWGVVATWSGGCDVVGIFDAAYLDPLGVFEGVAPVFHAAESDFDGTLDQGQTLTIDGTVYTIVNVQTDGTGIVMIRMRT